MDKGDVFVKWEKIGMRRKDERTSLRLLCCCILRQIGFRKSIYRSYGSGHASFKTVCAHLALGKALPPMQCMHQFEDSVLILLIVPNNMLRYSSY